MNFKHYITLLMFLGTFSQSFAGDGFLLKRELTLSSGETLSLAYLNLNSSIKDSVSKRVFAKRPGRSFMSSAVLPGAGQYYNGSTKKAIGFFVAEIALWWGYATLQGNANDKVEEYKAFAKENWDYDFWISTGGADIVGDNIDISSTGGPIMNNTYYENIGKYDKFNEGWSDAVPGSDDTKKRQEYRNLQQDANNLFSLATTVASTVMMNHILSAAEAVYTAKKLNDAASVNISLRAIPVRTGDRISSRLSLTVAW